MLKQAYYGAMSGLARVQQHRPLGTTIWGADWDICIVLDSCRVDLLREFWPDVGAQWSVASVTTEWLANTFHRRQSYEPRDTAMVSATPHTRTVFENESAFPNADVPAPSAFAGWHELWRSHATDAGAVPPSVMRDATIEAYREHDSVVAHWLQPHEPFIAESAPLVGGGATDANVWRGLQAGDLDPDEVVASYRATLEMALEEVERVLSSVDAKVLVTADHGNAFGEWGIYGHPYGWPQPAVRRVPWTLRDATPTAPVETAGVLDAAAGSVDVQEQLAALGYR